VSKFVEQIAENRYSVQMSRHKKIKESDVANILPTLIREKGWERQFDLHTLFSRWQELVGEEISDCARPLKIERGVLWIEVENSAWLQQLQYEKMDLMDVLNNSLKLSALKDIKMILPKGKEEQVSRKQYPDIRFVRPEEKEIDAFKTQISCIEDEKCREALMQFWYLARACKRG